MFGWKRFIKDCTAFGKMTNLTEEQNITEAFKIVGRFGRTNYLAGCLTVTAGVVTGMIVKEQTKKKKAKKNKELKDTDK